MAGLPAVRFRALIAVLLLAVGILATGCGSGGDSSTGRDLCSQPTMSRWENAPDLREVIRLTYAMIDTYCASYKRPPSAVTLDIDDTLDVVHGHQQMSLFNAHYDERCFLPIHVYDTATARPVALLQRPGTTPSGAEIRRHVRRLVRRIRQHWPNTRLTIRGDGHYGRPEVMAWCEANAVTYILGLSGNTVLSGLVEPLADETRGRRALTGADAVRRYTEVRYGAKSWRCERRVAARIEATAKGLDIRYVVTNRRSGTAQWLYDTFYCARGQAENLIKLHKSQLASDRTSCRSPLANQVRLVLHTAAYWLMLTLRDAIPRPQTLAAAEFTTLRLRLIKIAARISETATRGSASPSPPHVRKRRYSAGSPAACNPPDHNRRGNRPAAARSAQPPTSGKSELKRDENTHRRRMSGAHAAKRLASP